MVGSADAAIDSRSGQCCSFRDAQDQARLARHRAENSDMRLRAAAAIEVSSGESAKLRQATAHARVAMFTVTKSDRFLRAYAEIGLPQRCVNYLQPRERPCSVR